MQSHDRPRQRTERLPRPLRCILTAWRARYDRIGCLAGIIYFVGLGAGLFVSLWICEVITISLMRGPRAFFAEGLRYGDHHGNVLSDGQPVPMGLRVLTLPMFFVLMPAWMIGSLFVITFRRRNVHETASATP